LATLGAAEVKKTGQFDIPGVAMLKTRVKPATKAGKREIFGKRSDGEGQASQDSCESIPCRSHQEVHLDFGILFSAASQVFPFQLLAVGIPLDKTCEVALVQLLKITPCLRNCMFPC